MTTTRVAAAGPSGAAAVEVINPSGQGRFVLVCEHASNAIPEEYADLGLDGAALESHIAWDPGALEVAISMSGSFDAPLVAQNISRLVYDCNRPPMADDAIDREFTIEVPRASRYKPQENAAKLEKTGIIAVARLGLARLVGGAIVGHHQINRQAHGRPRAQPDQQAESAQLWFRPKSLARPPLDLSLRYCSQLSVPCRPTQDRRRR